MAIIEQSLEEWREEIQRRAGDPPDPSKLAFECPKCGNVATAQQFLDLGKKADQAATNCIGRFNAEAEPGCDWAAYGLFGVLDHGRILSKPDGDIKVFEFAGTPR